jgi:hypothetical protein
VSSVDAGVFQRTPVSTRSCAWALWLLTGLFAFRVVAQPAALAFDRLLPSFNSWDGGVVPYPVLLVTQLMILGWLARTAWRFGTGRVTPRPSIGRAALAFGGVYFAVMFLRLLLGATVLSDVRWFASPLPAFFHSVLATYLLVYGYCHVHTVSGSGSR